MSRAAWLVYVVTCRDGSLYTGCTNDLPRRVAAHAAGRGARYTRSRLPVALVYAEPARDRGAALRREAAIKRLDRPGKLALIASRAPARTLRTVPRGRRALGAPKPAGKRPVAYTELIDTHKGRPSIMHAR